MVRTVVNFKLSIYLLDCRMWPWHECPKPSGVLTQALLQHVDQCMRYEDVVTKDMLAQLACTLEEWRCNLFTDLIDEMELWDWNMADKDFWLRVAESLHS